MIDVIGGIYGKKSFDVLAWRKTSIFAELGVF